jgi:hypothetical protein
MSGTFIDHDAESDQYMSLPGTPTADDETFIWKGESVDDYPVLWWLIFVNVPRIRPFLRISPRFRNVSWVLNSPRYYES